MYHSLDQRRRFGSFMDEKYKTIAIHAFRFLNILIPLLSANRDFKPGIPQKYCIVCVKKYRAI